jgi:hypothetical protein
MNCVKLHSDALPRNGLNTFVRPAVTKDKRDKLPQICYLITMCNFNVEYIAHKVSTLTAGIASLAL